MRGLSNNKATAKLAAVFTVAAGSVMTYFSQIAQDSVVYRKHMPDEIKAIIDNRGGITTNIGYTVGLSTALQPITIGLANAYTKKSLSKPGGEISAYPDIIKKMYNEATWRDGNFKNMKRRYVAFVHSAILIDLKKQGLISEEGAAFLGTMAMSMLSVIFEEVQEKREQAGVSGKLPFQSQVTAYSFIWARNFLLNTAIFIATDYSDKLSNYLYENNKEACEGVGITKQHIGMMTFFAMSFICNAATIIPDGLATKAATGKDIIPKELLGNLPIADKTKIFNDLMQSSVRGGMLRGFYGFWITTLVSQGLNPDSNTRKAIKNLENALVNIYNNIKQSEHEQGKNLKQEELLEGVLEADNEEYEYSLLFAQQTRDFIAAAAKDLFDTLAKEDGHDYAEGPNWLEQVRSQEIAGKSAGTGFERV